jgi:hypothetical protein
MIRVHSNRLIPLRPAVIRTDTEHVSQHLGIARYQLIWSNTDQRPYNPVAHLVSDTPKTVTRDNGMDTSSLTIFEGSLCGLSVHGPIPGVLEQP